MSTHTKKIIVLIFTIIAFMVFGIVFLRAFYYSPSDEVPLPPQMKEKNAEQNVNESTAAIKIPSSVDSNSMLLIIPKIKVDARVEEVGITSRGNMAAPKIFSEVGWYKYGVFPGTIGSAVMAGHVDNGLAFPAVFNHLQDLAVGDDIYFETGNQRLHFTVTKKNIYDFNASPEKISQVFSEDDGKFLKLITCAGTWIPEYKTHDKRLVVSAVLVK